MKRSTLIAVAAASVVAIVAGAGTAAAATADHTATFSRHPKNVIFLLGDGMGTQEITAARYYQGVGNPLNVDRLPVHRLRHDLVGQAGRRRRRTCPTTTPTRPRPARCGRPARRRIDERISQGPSSADDVPGREPARRSSSSPRSAGMKVGNVSTAEITDATPAVLASHISLRGCQGPADMAACPTETKAAGGLGSIAEQEVDHKVDVLLGGGRARFEQTITGGPTPARPSSSPRRPRATSTSTDAAGLAARDGSASRCSACSTRAT